MEAPDGQSAIRSALGGGRVRPGPDQVARPSPTPTHSKPVQEGMGGLPKDHQPSGRSSTYGAPEDQRQQGHRSQEARHRSQEARHRSQEARLRSQEARHRVQEARHRVQEARLRSQETRRRSQEPAVAPKPEKPAVKPAVGPEKTSKKVSFNVCSLFVGKVTMTPAAAKKSAAAPNKPAVVEKPAATPKPEAAAHRSILSGGGRRSNRSLAASERAKARHARARDEPMEIEEAQDEPMEIEEGQAMPQPKETSQKIWIYNQAHGDQQAALLNPLFWVRRIFAPNYDRAGNIVQPQMTADECANYFATADTQLTLARNTFRRVVVPINVPGHWLLAMIDLQRGNPHLQLSSEHGPTA
ncbi:hypothetical protein L596_004366 [Steinernema carpocapsae]|uniref:Uncharacterized protein n=1 Tax=Steinernema carpocapsae TaxID=34508 RepID=A0A4U8UVR7_STECR|nr:hypothetical protein L596_004366 [Steinernema carpocapsae]